MVKFQQLGRFGQVNFVQENLVVRDRPTKQSLIQEPSQFLSGWKEIANYLGKGVRTVQRYERHMGLPVRRPAGRSSGSVVATRAELDAWVKASPIREVYCLTNPLPEYEHSTRAIKNGLSEMNRLRDQMFLLGAEMKRSLELLRQSVRSLQEQVSERLWENHLALRRSAPLFAEEEELASLERSQMDVVSAPTRYPKAS